MAFTSDVLLAVLARPPAAQRMLTVPAKPAFPLTYLSVQGRLVVDLGCFRCACGRGNMLNVQQGWRDPDSPFSSLPLHVASVYQSLYRQALNSHLQPKQLRVLSPLHFPWSYVRGP